LNRKRRSSDDVTAGKNMKQARNVTFGPFYVVELAEGDITALTWFHCRELVVARIK